MPFARIDLAQGKPPEYRAAVADVVYEGIVEILKAPAGDRFMVIGEHSRRISSSIRTSSTSSERLISSTSR